MNHRLFAAIPAVGAACASQDAGPGDSAAGAELIERGRYLAIITGCKDCHTSG